jgi:CheY-like chemotaxis protein
VGLFAGSNDPKALDGMNTGTNRGRYDVARQIRQQPWGRDVVLVALTGWGQDEDRRRSREAGLEFHVVKPVDLVTLERLPAGLPATRG